MSRSRPAPDLGELEARIGHDFRNRDLLVEALTHVTAITTQKRPRSYQRLEFLGDRVLGLAVAEMLLALYRASDEGSLSRRLSELVRKETCFEVAEAWGVREFMPPGSGKGHSDVRKSESVLADVCEAIIGAVFQDAGYESARAVVERAFAGRIAALRNPPSNPKAELQEWALARRLPTPTYELVERSGPDHAPHFRIRVRVEGVPPAEGVGSTKRAGEQEAALNLLVGQGVRTGSTPAAAPSRPED